MFSVATLQSLPLDLQIEEWEIEVQFLKKFIRLTEENRGLFFASLGKETDLDTYLTSPVYYALTGRKRLWIYQEGNSYVPVCWHPNVDGQILVFPARGAYNPNILKNLLTTIPIPPKGVRLARIKKEDVPSQLLTNMRGSIGRSINLQEVNEEILDWTFPVRILSTDDVRKLEGNHHLRTRNYVKRLQQDHVVTMGRLSSSLLPQIMEFVNRWAQRRTCIPSELKELIAPYKTTFDLLTDEAFNVDGLVFYVDGIIQAVSMWEPPNTSTLIANAWVNLCNTSVKGLSEFVMKSTSETLFLQDIPYINYGGSETPGLDNFKNKFVPAFSIDLASIDADIQGVDVILHSLYEIKQGLRIAA